MDYDHFIAAPGSANVATTGAWAAIVSKEKLHVETVPAKESGGNADVSVDLTQFWSTVDHRDTRWNHKFSSRGNGAFFGQGGGNALLNSAWTGDDYGCTLSCRTATTFANQGSGCYAPRHSGRRYLDDTQRGV